MVRPGREADPPPPVRELRGLEAPYQGTMEGRGLSLRVEASQGAQNCLALRWRKGNQSSAVLPSETKVGQMVNIPPRDEEGREEGSEGKRVRWKALSGGQGPPQYVYKGGAGGGPSPERDVGQCFFWRSLVPFALSVFPFLFFLFFLWGWNRGEGERVAHLNTRTRMYLRGNAVWGQIL